MHRERQLRQLAVTHSTTYTVGVAPKRVSVIHTSKQSAKTVRYILDNKALASQGIS